MRTIFKFSLIATLSSICAIAIELAPRHILANSYLITETNTVTVSTKAQDTLDFEQIVKEQYFALWRDTSENPYSVELARQLYLTDERLTAFDTDALPAEGADSRIEGWSEYVSIWPEVFAGIRRFEAQEIQNFQVRREGNWALVTFDMSGDGELETGETFDVFKHFSLVWIETEDGWRIMHEHISDGEPPEASTSRFDELKTWVLAR